MSAYFPIAVLPTRYDVTSRQMKPPPLPKIGKHRKSIRFHLNGRNELHPYLKGGPAQESVQLTVSAPPKWWEGECNMRERPSIRDYRLRG
jgi:hypothetical protein